MQSLILIQFMIKRKKISNKIAQFQNRLDDLEIV